MAESVAGLRRAEWLDVMATPGFIGLPQEEAERLLGAVEVLALREKPGDPALLPLVTFTAIHYNYSWFSHVPPAKKAGAHAQRSLGIQDALGARDGLLFLDPSIAEVVRDALLRRVGFVGGQYLRLAGLFNAAHEPQDACVGLIYIAKLRQPGVACHDAALEEVLFYGNGDLRQARDEFDACSRALIDNLHAL